MVKFRDNNAGWSHRKKTENSFLENVEEFIYLGTTLTKQNFLQEEIKNTLKWGNGCCYSVPKLWYSNLLSKNLKIKIHRTIILPVVLCRFEVWSGT
jgi:hypothetical protein